MELPEGWKLVRLGDIAKIIMGQSPPSSTYNKDGIGAPFYQGKKEFGDVYLKEPTTWCSKPKKITNPEDLLISVRAPIGDVNITKNKCAIGRGLAIIRPENHLSLFYIFYFLKYYKPFWDEKGKGSTFKAIKKTDLENLLIPIPYKDDKPDLQRQKEIVNKIETLFNNIDKAIELRQKALNETKNLFNSVLNRVFKDEGFKLVRLGDVGKYINGRAFKPSEWEEVGLPIIRIQNLNNPKAPYNYYSKPVEKKYYIQNGDLLISWSASIDAYIWNGGKALLNQHIFKVELKNEYIDKKYMYFAIKPVLMSIKYKTHGSTMKHITKKKFENLLIPIPYKDNKPDLQRQKEISEYLENLHNKIKRLEQLQEKQLNLFKELKKSILNKAFKGELV